MEKHAYLILAHTDIEALKCLIRSIDDERNLIFVHADKKWRSFDRAEILPCARRSSLYILQERRKVQWGGSSFIATELRLMKEALGHDGWRYCHIMSGQDICIKTQDEIHAFFEAHDGKEFLTFCGKDWNEAAQARVAYYYPSTGRNRAKLLFAKIGRKVQKLFHVDRRRRDAVAWVGGSGWASLDRTFTEFLVAHEKEIVKRMRGTFCADELWLHTIAYNSAFKDAIYLCHIAEKNDDTDVNMYLSNMRFIDWVRGTPYVFREEDLPELLSSPCLFARKADPKLSVLLLKKLQEGDLR